MSENSLYRLIDDLNCLIEESEKLIDKMEHMIIEEDKGDNITDEDMQYDREDDNLWKMIRENAVTVV